MINLTAADIEAIKFEADQCRQVQSWASGTRSQWVTELDEIVAAWDRLQASGDSDSDDTAELAAALNEAIEAAETARRELATKVARELATDIDTLAEKVVEELRDMDISEAEFERLSAEVEGIGTIAGLVEWMRDHEIEVCDSTSGKRDGYEVGDTWAKAYASMRDWDNHYGYVEVDLLTGDVKAFD